MEVKKVEAPFLKGSWLLRPVDLSEAGEAGSNRKKQIVALHLLAELVHKMLAVGARSDKAHVTSEDAPELWQLVHPGLSENSTDTSDSRVVLAGPHGLPLLFRVLDHGAELPESVGLTVPPHSNLAIEDRSTILHQNRDRYQDRHRKKRDKTEQRQAYVEETFGPFDAPALLEGNRFDVPRTVTQRPAACLRAGPRMIDGGCCHGALNPTLFFDPTNGGVGKAGKSTCEPEESHHGSHGS